MGRGGFWEAEKELVSTMVGSPMDQGGLARHFMGNLGILLFWGRIFLASLLAA
jgi:hypothetical protein